MVVENRVEGTVREAIKRYAPSLKELESSELAEFEKLKHSESSHEFYMSVWKASPFVLVTLITTTVYAFALYGSLGWLFLTVFVAIFVLGYFAWYTAGQLDSEVATQSIRRDRASREVERRKAKVEGLFVAHVTGAYRVRIEDLHWDDSILELKAGDFATQFVPQLLEDMRNLDKDLVEQMSLFDQAVGEYLKALVKYYNEAKEVVMALESGAGVKEIPHDHMEQVLRSLYYVLSGLVSSEEDLVRTRAVAVTSSDMRLIRLMWSKRDDKNPYPELLQNENLKTLVMNAEDYRVRAINVDTDISYMKKVLFEDSQTERFRPGI